LTISALAAQLKTTIAAVKQLDEAIAQLCVAHKSLAASGGSVFLNLISAAMVE
jgi:hypothetical protein